MKLFRMRRKSENGEEEKELILDTDAEDEDAVEEMDEAEAETGGPPGAPTLAAVAGPSDQTDASALRADPLAQISAEAAGEPAAAEKPPDGDPASPQTQDSLDDSLLDLFREAKNEVQETTLGSELPDIPIQELLGDLVSISRRLGIPSKVRAKPNPHPSDDLNEGGK